MGSGEPAHHRCGTTHYAVNRFNGVQIHELDGESLVASVLEMVDCGRSHVVHFLSADPLVIAAREPALAEVLNRADLNVADGLPVVWAIRATGGTARRITGTEGVHEVCRGGVPGGLTHYFYGGSEEALDGIVENLTAAYPGLQIAGTKSPPFRALETDEVAAFADEIRSSKADVLWVALGAPKQNYEAERFRDHAAAPVIVTVGAAFDFIGGTKRRAPSWMRKLGLEWVFRMFQEPRRLGPRYLKNNPRFLADTVRQMRHKPSR